MTLFDGILLADKPAGWTSHDVCAFVRKRFNLKKVGHAGTLDPLATGLLVVLLGRATKHSMALSGCDKEYAGVMELGTRTDSHDRLGKVLDTASWESVTLEQICEKAKDFTGEIFQTPPMVSALKHQGVRLYQLARRGVSVPREPRPIQVYEFRILSKDGRFVHFSARVSKGTYVRTLVNDLGDALGCLASLHELRRVKSGHFGVEAAVTVEELRKLTPAELQARMLPLPVAATHARL